MALTYNAHHTHALSHYIYLYRCNCYSVSISGAYTIYVVYHAKAYAIVISVHLMCTEILIVRASSLSFVRSNIWLSAFDTSHTHIRVYNVHTYTKHPSLSLLLLWHWYNFVVRFRSCLLYLCALVHNIISIPIIKSTSLLCLCILYFFKFCRF